MNVAIIGTGYVGLTTGACFAEIGHNVTCVDIDKEKIASLKKGHIPIYEPGLKKLVQKNSKNSRLSFTTDSKKAIQSAEIVICAVGTPLGKDHQADLKYVKQVAQDFSENLDSYKLFVNKSTVPVGTGAQCEKIIKQTTSAPFDIVSNPEFLREGSAIKDTMNPDRIVIGVKSPKAKNLMKTLYKYFLDNNTEILFTDIASAEIIKYASNSFLATKISFINEMANFCEKAGGNIKDIAKGIGLDSRIGSKFLNAGIGYGGSCLPKDVRALIQTGLQHDHEFQIISSAEKVNQAQKSLLFKKLQKHLGPLESKTIAIWGLSFKPNTDDMREAPALAIIKLLQASGALIKAHDPQALKNAKSQIEPFNITFHSNAYEAAKSADALMILTEWDEYKNADLKKLKSAMNGSLILDGRQTLNKKEAIKQGLIYITLGKNISVDKTHKNNKINTQQLLTNK
jgi:UDPglucose 6-dehydrogenase